MSICEDCILYGRCSGGCGDVDDTADMFEKENDLIDYIESEGV